MHVAIAHARVQVRGRFRTEGSVLAQTVRASCLGMEVRLEVESPENPAKVAGVLRNAENGCYAMQSLLNPVPVERAFSLNGKEMDLVTFSRPSTATA